MSRGKKGLFTGLALLGLSVMLWCVGPASAALTPSSGAAAGSDNLAPGPVASLTAVVDLTGPSIALTWELASDDYVRQAPAGMDFTSGGVFVNVNDVARYQVWRSAGGGTPELLATLPAGTRSYVDETVQNGSTYVYRIIAVDAAGNESAPVESELLSLGPPPEAQITPPAGTMDFGEFGVDEQAVRKIIVANGATDPMAVLSVAVELEGVGFSAAPLSLTLAAGSRDTIDVTFDAAAVGNLNGVYTGMLTLRTNDPTQPSTLYLLTAAVTRGLVPAIDLSGREFNFGLVPLATAATRTLTIRNVGRATLEGTLSLEGAEVFALSETAFSLEAGESIEVEISFMPAAVQLYEATVTIASNDPANPELTVALFGRGTEVGQVLVDPATGEPIYGDFDGNAEITFDDFFLFADQFGTSATSPNWNPAFDLDGNGAVDFDDFFIFADNFGKSGVYQGG